MDRRGARAKHDSQRSFGEIGDIIVYTVMFNVNALELFKDKHLQKIFFVSLPTIRLTLA